MSKLNAETKPSNKIKNYYQIMDKSFKPKKHNPKYKDHGIELEFNMLIAGQNGTLKTNTLLDMIHRMSNTFQYIFICLKCADEPLYNYLKSKIDDDHLHFYEINDDNPPPKLEDFDKVIADLGDEPEECQKLVIYDDLMNESPKTNKNIIDIHLRGRKKHFSTVYLSQSYYVTPKKIRDQCKYFILKKSAMIKDLKRILAEQSMGISINELVKMFKYATDDPLSFFLIDNHPITPQEKKFRKGWLEILRLEPEEERTPTGRLRNKIKIDVFTEE